ncbi:TusE/DsrC/DsvC family sulfur relay protein [Thiohalocapsa marina]|uniref:Sulfurtransferase n=1 Tax=Thiohalocapsa marina TaxID=424902 RepID=A0A5M8FN04_9GAMM|nr:TusE/DsrC/DsvC family sulfur relay protein [Thiohalocapsa marina]KAA6185076.1 TusE/DsrC/DsvC family sulfur relay protein [Thiohalocapsa marina]
MTAMQIAGRNVQFNKKGHLVSFQDWDNDLAAALAAEDGLKLTPCHWSVINFLRDYYAFHEIPPSPKVIVREIGHQLSTHMPCTRKSLMSLFPNGGCKQACRIAGLPDYYCYAC